MVVPVPSQQNKAKFRGINFPKENCNLLGGSTGGSYEIYEMYEICTFVDVSLRIQKPEIVHTWKPKKWEFDSFDAKASRTPKHSQANIGKLNEIDMFHHEHSNLTFDPTNMHPNPPFVVAPFRHRTIQEGQKLWDVGHGSEIGTQSWPPTASKWSWSHFHRIFLTWSFQIWLPGWVVNRMKLTTQLLWKEPFYMLLFIGFVCVFPTLE